MTINTPTARRTSLLIGAVAALALAGCDSDSVDQAQVAAAPAPLAPSPVVASAPPSDKPNYAVAPAAPAPGQPSAPNAALSIDELMAGHPAQVPAQPNGPNPQADAARALLASDFATACAYLEFERFDPAVCDYFARRANEQQASLSPRVLETFLRSQNVARRSGSVVGWFEEPRSYEVRVNGQASILEVIDTRFTTTGRFNMWARRMDDEEMELSSGRVINVPVYLEWPLADVMLEAMRARGDEVPAAARSLFVILVENWASDRHSPDDEVIRHVNEWPAFLAASRAARAATPAAEE
jgi:hypothetical protein